MTPENIGNYQEKRAARRNARADKKGAKNTAKRDKFDKKTEFIVAKAKENKSNTNTKQQQAMADCILAGGTYKNGVCS